METIRKALTYFKSRREFCEEVGVRYDMITKYLAHTRFPSTRLAKKIEEKTKGEIKALEILEEKLRIKFEQSIGKKL